MLKKWIAGLAFVIVLLVAGFPLWQDQDAAVEDTRFHVVASFYPLAEFARNVGGDFVTVQTIVPAGTEPHDFEPTPNDVKSILDADMVLYNGASLDSWMAKILSENDFAGTALDMSTAVSLKEAIEEEEHESEDTEEEGEFDPHFWLDPVSAQELVRTIAENFSALDKENAAGYNARAYEYIAKLQKLHATYEGGLARCRLQDVIVSHNAFAYIGARYGFTIHSISGFSPNAEPSANTLAELSDLAKALDVRYVLVETLVSPKTAEAVANEAGAETLVLNPLEGLTPDEVAQGLNYLSVMEQNLTTLKKVRDCEN